MTSMTPVSITDRAIRRPVATAMLFLGLIVVGIVSFRNLPIDLLPKIELTQLTVRVVYPNVGPEEIERLITDPIENAVSGLPNLERISSWSQEGRTWIRLDMARGTNLDEAANDLRSALDRLRDDLPDEADAPEILKLDLDRAEVVSLAATSTRDLESLTRILENEIAGRFEQIPGVGTINVRGGIYREIRIELDRDRLKAAGLSALDVQGKLSRENITLPGGNVKRGMSDLYVRALGEFQTVEEISRIVLTTVDGLPIRVRDVAQVRDDYEDVQYLVEVNGVPSVSLGIQKQSGSNTVAVAEQIRAEAERLNAERDDVHLTVISDQSELIRQSIDSVQSSALWGSLLAVLVLYFFLRNGSATSIIAVSIPVSVIASFGLLYFGGLTLNQMTFGGLALGVGLIVDNAIVVLESIVRKREQEGAEADAAAHVGTREVAGAVIASTLTTCVIFLPVVFTTTTSGALFKALAVVVVFALACSLFVALTLVPMLASRFLRLTDPARRERSWMLRFFEAFEVRYSELLRRVAERKVAVFAVTAVLLAGALLAFPSIPVELAPQMDADEISVDLEMAQGTNIAVVRSYLGELEEMVRQALPADQVEFVSTEVRGSNAEIEISLVPQGERTMASSVIADRLREAVDGHIPGGEIRVRAQSGMWILRRIFRSSGSDEALQLELRGYDLEVADQIAARMIRKIEQIPGILDVRASRQEGRPEESLLFDRERIADLGLSVQEVARTIQANVGGLEAGRLRQGGDQFPIVVRLRPEDRLTGQDLESLSVRAPDGTVVPLSTLTRREAGRGPLEIQRIDGQRVTYITANLESGLALGDAVEQVRERLAGEDLPIGYSLYFGGEYEEQQKAARDFAIAILMALTLVYMLMAAQFERFLDPLIVMAAVPVALVGVVPMLLFTGTTLNIQSVMGLVMLIGIVVNNAIVLVDTINLLRRERGLGVIEAVVEAGRLRLRPILMTTTTTVLGLVPLALGWGPGAEIQAPLARVVIGGLTASTLVTLLLIPVTYITANQVLERVRATRGGVSRGGGLRPNPGLLDITPLG